MTIHTILVLTDFSVGAEYAVERAALLAQTHKAALRLMYFSEDDTNAIDDPVARIVQRARQLSNRYGVTAHPVLQLADTLPDVLREARDADLLVLEQRHEEMLGLRWPSSTPRKLIRHCDCPVLVVRQKARLPYANLVVAVDFSGDWHEVVRYARDFGGNAALQVRRLSLADAKVDMPGDALPQPFPLPTRAMRRHLMRGPAFSEPVAHLAQAEIERGTDLLVLRSRGRWAVLDFLLGSPFERLARTVNADMLVVPERRAGALGAVKPRVREWHPEQARHAKPASGSPARPAAPAPVKLSLLAATDGRSACHSTAEQE